MSGDLLLQLVAEHGPWAVMVFFLLWRDSEKDKATRVILDRNALILTEISTVIRERLPRS
ncbi:hypothetical protein EF888_09010 [Silicimonas algicola]|uniref:Uncharacterized protein n=1 Tax=Silicimonas algicola TaxID=1826607 RepID=A0A316GB79_9RHOB|nr:hypothetical protein [Silicimonas algicola]AZQ67255.1 hypothetical protein EF888_09010 [Silicimonas algicola]PWK56920.1 hypothetical protein C8D95_103154 [Silicimonas algicola]